MKFIIRWTPFAVFILVVVSLMVLSPDRFGYKQELLASPAPKDEVADQVMKDVHLMETVDGEKEWELWAEQAISFRGQGSWSVQKVKVIFFREDGVELTVTGERGTIRVETKDMLIEENVVTTTTDNYIFLTDSLVYNSKNRELKTAHPVKIKSPKDSKGHRILLNGIGLLADMKKSVLFLHRDVRGTKQMGEERVLRVRSNEASLSSFTNQANFIGQVVMNLETLTVAGPRATFLYDKKGSSLDSIIVEGGVKVSDEDKWATAEHLKIFVEENKYVFSGAPRVVQDSDEIKGKRIIFFNGGDQIRVLSGKASLSEDN